MLVVTLLISFSIFLIIGVPIAFVLGLTPLVAFLYEGEPPLMLVAQRIFTGMDNPVLMAIPFFILAGNIMSAGGLTQRLVTFCKVLVGSVRGGLAHINVVISMIFAGITGAAVADTSAIGSILIPAMEREGYDVDFSSAVTATSSTIGPVIPPSIPFIIYGALGEISIRSLFLAGLIPGVLLGLFQMGVVAYYARKRNYPKGSLPSAREALRAIFDAGLVLMMPIIILGGILSGVFTPTEAAGAGAFVAFFIALMRGRLTKENIVASFMNTLSTTGMIFIMIIGAMIFNYMLVLSGLTTALADYVTGLPLPPVGILVAILCMYILLGCLMDAFAMLLILVPILFPVILALEFDPIWFGTVTVIMVEMGLITPPIGLNVFIIAGTARDVPLSSIYRGVMPFIIAIVICVAILVAFPQIALFIPNISK